jgi:hypothetical protein
LHQGTVLEFFTTWANAPFTIAAGIAALFALLQATGATRLLGHHDVAHDHELAHDHVSHDHAEDHEHDAEHPALPLTLSWQVFSIVFAVTGFALNALYADAGRALTAFTLLWTMPSSALAGSLALRGLARLLRPVLATKAQEATTRAELVGHVGVVISSEVRPDFGEVRIRDKTGHDVRLLCKLAEGHAPAREKESVVVLEYDRERDELFVAPIDAIR